MAARPRAVLIVAVLAVVVAAFASYQLWKYLERQKAEVEAVKRAALETEKVVVVGEKEIPVGTKIESASVRVIDWPKANLPQGYFSSPEQVTGRLPLQTLVPGDIITSSKLVPLEAPQSVMIYRIPEGHRAITVGVDQVSGVAGFITPGSMVDVLLTTTPPGHPEPITKMIFQNIPVLAIGQIVEEKEGKPVLVPTVTLDVTPVDAEKLAMASAGGTLRLLLRRSGDTGIANTPGANITRVISLGRAAPEKARVVSKAAPKAAGTEATTKKPEQKPLYTVEVWQNGKKTELTFPYEDRR